MEELNNYLHVSYLPHKIAICIIGILLTCIMLLFYKSFSTNKTIQKCYLLFFSLVFIAFSFYLYKSSRPNYETKLPNNKLLNIYIIEKTNNNELKFTRTENDTVKYLYIKHVTFEIIKKQNANKYYLKPEMSENLIKITKEDLEHIEKLAE